MSLKSVQPLKLVATGSDALNGATPVAVAVNGLLASDVLLAHCETLAGTPAPFSCEIDGSNVSLVSAAGNTSTVRWTVLRKCD